ncbi:MAG TPA: serine hydrolase [Solirubrobacteraceae bacterium]|nr:serine hydrolase [Solirubrobacteraceae bacterium]
MSAEPLSVPADSWQIGPHNRWAYVHLDEIVPTVPVPRRDGPVTPLGADETDLHDLLDDVPELDGLAVVHRGRLVAEHYGGEMTETSLHLSQSVGKSVAGLVAGILVGRGELDPSSLVTDHVPEVAGSGYEGATVRHVLDMTAAIDFVEDYAVFWTYDVACAWHPPVAGVPGTILEYLPTIGPAGTWTHGERFHYSTPNTDLLGIVLERVAGVPLAELISRELWGRLGAECDALLTVDQAGTGAIGGGFCATLRDYARLGRLVAEGGGGIVPADWVNELGLGDPAAFARATYATDDDGYRSQWWLRDGRPTARGIHGQLVAADLATQTAVVVLSSWPEALDPARDARHRSLVADVIARLAS